MFMPGVMYHLSKCGFLLLCRLAFRMYSIDFDMNIQPFSQTSCTQFVPRLLNFGVLFPAEADSENFRNIWSARSFLRMTAIQEETRNCSRRFDRT